ncbi:short-chain dehydrogenase/reductase SDR [Kipferlia bialata]|uniref:Short-chain dehydrogenase/reductase SDR n=1 Tax=Kipferlia bialata TaxID=797122 RepID=A0A9K3D5L4_9EUKA|nr:short-chain dehydrogenase/reductase SDR [Kipferlia bialata]|eukprot:g9788.t1
MSVGVVVCWVLGVICTLRVLVSVYPSVLPCLTSQRLRVDREWWILVTGATGGVGAALCHRIAMRGGRLIISSTTDAKLQLLRDALLASGATAVEVLPLDLTLDSRTVRDTVTAAIQGKVLQGAFLNAGLGGMRCYQDMDPDAAHKMFQVNAASTFTLADTLYRVLVGQGQGAERVEGLEGLEGVGYASHPSASDTGSGAALLPLGGSDLVSPDTDADPRMNVCTPMTQAIDIYTPSAGEEGYMPGVTLDPRFLVFTGSLADIMQGPNMTIYHASKRFITGMAQGLHSEGRRHKVSVHAVLPGSISGTSFYTRPGMVGQRPSSRVVSDLYTCWFQRAFSTPASNVARVACNVVGTHTACCPVGLMALGGYALHTVGGPNLTALLTSLCYPILEGVARMQHRGEGDGPVV